MKISYIANIRIPTERAHGIQIVKMCEAFSHLGHEVELVVPLRKNEITADVFSFYRTRETFKIKYIPSFGFFGSSRLSFWLQAVIFSFAAFFYQLFYPADLIFCRDELPVFCLSFLKKNVVWEAHGERDNFLVKFLLKKILALVAITRGLKDFYSDKGIASEKILVAHDSVDLKMFSVERGREDCRLQLGLPVDYEIILYTGHLYDWKGAQVLAEAATFFPAKRWAVFVGGTEKDLKEFRNKNKKNSKLMIIGHRPYEEMPLWMKAANVLILPNTSPRPTSPMKLFEYMASGVPIVSSDLPTIREVLNENNALLVEPGNPEALWKGIGLVINDDVFGKKISQYALATVKENSWEKRGEKIMTFIKNVSA